MTSLFAGRSFIEPLEDRIAPALLVNGANLLGGAGNPTTGDTSVGDNAVTLVKVLSGQALVWYNNGTILSISFGPNTNLQVFGDISGDLVGNLMPDGTLSDSDNNPANGEDGGRLLGNNLLGLKTSPLAGGADGSLHNIITGGSVNGLSISGELLGVYAGDGAFHSSSYVQSGGVVTSDVGGLDINPIVSGVQSTFDFTEAGSQFVAGASIKTAKITKATSLQMIAGNGSPLGGSSLAAGPAGGSISGITIENAIVQARTGAVGSDTTSYWLIAGNGSDGKSGGAGGSISNVIEKSSYGDVIMTAGQGGNGGGGAGGAGGSISMLDVQSNSSHYIVTAGNGGTGAPAGDGGKLTNNNFSNRAPVSGIIVNADFTGDGIDDVLVVDASTGQMLINSVDNPNSTTPLTNFAPVLQHHVTGGDDVFLIDPIGTSPSAAAAIDIDGDGDLDIVVAYKNSNNLGVFLNHGDGSFWDASLGADGEFATATFGLSFSPAKMALNNNGTVALAENANGKGIMHYGVISGSTVDKLALDVAIGSNSFTQPVSDIVWSKGTLYTAFSSGVISELQIAGLNSPKAFTVASTGIAIAGGLTDLEVDSTDTRLIALSETGHTLTLFDITADPIVSLATFALDPASDPLVAHFQHDGDLKTSDDIVLLSLVSGDSTFSKYTQAPDDNNPATTEPYSLTDGVTEKSVLKNFVPLYAGGAFYADAALAGSMGSFLITSDLATKATYPLPFASKIIDAHAGNGGIGININSGKTLGKGGAGGGINGINADANQINLIAGIGGDSAGGAAGAGGSVINPATFATSSLVTVTPTLIADVLLNIQAGAGGTPFGVANKTASGGAGGSLTGISIILDAGDITLTTGTGGNGNGGAGGAGGSFNTIKTVTHDGNLTLSTGAGGNALSGVAAGGAGGSINGLTHELSLDSNVELLEKAYAVTITTGVGGTSAGGVGGAGGSLNGVALTLDPSNFTYSDMTTSPALVDSFKDNTLRINVHTGNGGQGASGGAGGTIRSFSSTTVLDQKSADNAIFINYVTLQMTAGAGGLGTAGIGGAGGSIILSKPISGITQYDADANDASDPANRVPFIATAGNGGNGSAKGGAGGSITGLVLQNSAFADGSFVSVTELESAIVTAGNGGNGGTGDGGVGGNVSGALIGTQLQAKRMHYEIPPTPSVAEGGFLVIEAGNGGNGGTAGKGGAGGSVLSSNFGVVVSAAPLGLMVSAGNGGNGTLAGGLGGAVSAVQVSTPQSTDGISAVIYAGSGGNANSASGIGGKGGDVLNLNQGKDVNSSINLIEAGGGGDNLLGKAGAGGNVTGVKTVGFIGRPSNGTDRLGVFDEVDTGNGTIEFAQGVYSGRGGQGLTDGIAGAVTNVTARQIAAIAAAVDANGLFAAASKVSNIKAAVIGFDLDLDGVFDSTVPGTPKPSLSKPVDGFIFSASPLTQVSALPASSFIFSV